jgi:hypothetical protein
MAAAIMDWSGHAGRPGDLMMRKLLILAALAGVVGCEGFGGPFSKRDRPPPTPDPLLSPDIEEQQRWGRSRYAYPEHDRHIAPQTYSDRPTPSGR